MVGRIEADELARSGWSCWADPAAAESGRVAEDLPDVFVPAHQEAVLDAGKSDPDHALFVAGRCEFGGRTDSVPSQIQRHFLRC
ncbi:hypothetical protein GCM10011575_18870 [Microlunatus endophyticus]|uniref:Uncharacterized protein n=1 Tax=Microlunatus endophyticus TaxID=1716077 RepID=A0A917S7N6_9ACTN|nr:hypothetical protein GCM10011575_18870 [Microlunatus endophyticus]